MPYRGNENITIKQSLCLDPRLLLYNVGVDFYLCCRKPINGATPVPGPIMIRGRVGSSGNRKLVGRRKYILI